MARRAPFHGMLCEAPLFVDWRRRIESQAHNAVARKAGLMLPYHLEAIFHLSLVAAYQRR